jgi:hypothetical protein
MPRWHAVVGDPFTHALGRPQGRILSVTPGAPLEHMF